MSEHDSEGASESELGAADERAAAAPAPAARQAGRGPWLILLVLLVSLAAAVYYWIDVVHKPLSEDLAARLSAAERAQARLVEQIAGADATVASVAGQSATLETRMADLQRAQGDLEESLKSLFARDSQSSLEWVLAEVEYLVFAATQRLALERDATTAAVALRAADTRLRSARHPELVGLREQLARDIAALDAVGQPDIEGLAVFLAASATRVGHLPTKPIADLDMSFSRMSDENVSTQNWQGVAQALWADLKSLVEIKDGELEDGVLFDPDLRYFLQQNLRLELASARLAVLQHDTANFRAAAMLLIDLLDTYYDTDDAAVSALMMRLKAQLETELRPPVPSIAGSLDAVRAKRAALREAAVAGR